MVKVTCSSVRLMVLSDRTVSYNCTRPSTTAVRISTPVRGGYLRGERGQWGCLGVVAVAGVGVGLVWG